MRSRGLPCWRCYGLYLPGGGIPRCGDHLYRSAHILKSFCTQEIFFDVHGYVV
jgi:hypothetical protein